MKAYLFFQSWSADIKDRSLRIKFPLLEGLVYLCAFSEEAKESFGVQLKTHDFLILSLYIRKVPTLCEACSYTFEYMHVHENAYVHAKI